MLPFSFEWVWDAGHMIFMGGLWYAVSILGIGMTFCIIKTVIDVSGNDGDQHQFVRSKSRKVAGIASYFNIFLLLDRAKMA